MRNEISLTESSRIKRARYRFHPIDTFCQHVYPSRSRVVRDDNIEMDDREKIYLADISTCRRFTDRTQNFVLGDVDDLTNPSNDPRRDTLDRYPSEKNVGETDFRYCASYFSPFLLIP